MEEALDERRHGLVGHRFVDEDQPGEIREVGQHGVAGIQQAELVELPRVDIVGDDDTDRFERRSPGDEGIFDHPLDERLGNHGPPVDEAVTVPKMVSVGIGGDWRDAIDHRIRKGTGGADPPCEYGTVTLGGPHRRCSSNVPIAGEIVATEDGDGSQVGDSACLEAGNEPVEGDVRSDDRFGVARFGDGHGDDRRIRPSNDRDERIEIVGHVVVFDDAADDL